MQYTYNDNPWQRNPVERSNESTYRYLVLIVGQLKKLEISYYSVQSANYF